MWLINYNITTMCPITGVLPPWLPEVHPHLSTVQCSPGHWQAQPQGGSHRPNCHPLPHHHGGCRVFHLRPILKLIISPMFCPFYIYSIYSIYSILFYIFTKKLLVTKLVVFILYIYITINWKPSQNQCFIVALCYKQGLKYL